MLKVHNIFTKKTYVASSQCYWIPIITLAIAIGGVVLPKTAFETILESLSNTTSHSHLPGKTNSFCQHHSFHLQGS